MKSKTPKDLGVKIGSKEMALWKQVVNETKSMIEQAKNNLLVQEAFLRTAEEKLKKATKDFESGKV